MVKEFFEDYHIGEKLVTPGRTITETDLVLYAAFSGDWNPVHTDAEHAKQTRFGGRIAHGMLVLSVGGGLLLRLAPKSMIALYGVEKVRFMAPTRIGDTIHTESEVVKMTELDATRGLVNIRGDVKNQCRELVATFTIRYLVGRRDQETTA
jgi:3-hydroxybutyryl-CoA dehydratase